MDSFAFCTFPRLPDRTAHTLTSVLSVHDKAGRCRDRLAVYAHCNGSKMFAGRQIGQNIHLAFQGKHQPQESVMLQDRIAV